MASDHITDAQIDAFYNNRYGVKDWRKGLPLSVVDDMARTLCAALLAVEQAAWQPIDTAPRDGTVILVEGGPVEWRGYGWFSLKAQRSLQWEPERWRPLPPAPEAE